MSEKTASKKPLMLIIEDDNAAAQVMTAASQAAGFATEVVQDGSQAQDRLQAEASFAVILDLHLPRVSGITLLRQIRASERWRNTRVLVVTADPRLAQTIDAEADFVTIKPVSFTQIRDLAQRLLQL